MNLVLPHAALLVLLAATLATTQAQRSTYDPAAKNPQKQRGSFVDFVLNQINPANRDYGQEIEDARKAVIAKTIDNFLFWSNSCALVLLASAFLVITHQTKERKHRQLIAARFLTWYHNELLAARTRTLEEIGKFERLRKTMDARPLTRSVPETPELAAPQAPRAAGDSELMVEVNSLRQKMVLVEQSQNTLRQQNAQLSRLLREEQQKNHALKKVTSADTVVRKEGNNGKG
jgi:hypothetical protein